MKIAMIGTGYVGLVSGVCFSDFGHQVICVDKNAEKIEMLRKGKVPIYEPGLDVLMAKNVEAGRLTFTENLAEAVAGPAFSAASGLLQYAVAVAEVPIEADMNMTQPPSGWLGRLGHWLRENF